MILFLIGLLLLLVPGAFALRSAESNLVNDGKLRRGTFAAVVIIFFGYAGVLVLAAWQGAWPLPFERHLSLWAGIPLAIVGGTMYALARVRFGLIRRAWGLTTPRLEVSGVYRWSRHPQSFGLVLFFSGVSLASRSGAALALSCLLFITMTRWIPVEERFLTKLFGEAYEKYRERTPKLLGLPRRVQEQS